MTDADFAGSELIQRWRAWRRRRAASKLALQRQRAAQSKVEAHVFATKGFRSMASVVLRDTPDEQIVRVMRVRYRMPPERSWYAIRNDGSPVELSYADVLDIDTAIWR